MIENPKHDLIRKDGAIEIRRYGKIVLVSVENTGGSAFNHLFRYISGSNKSKTKINMTAPVITSEKIAMTSPVISSSDSMSFILPSKYTLETAPEPNDEKVKISEIPERHVATIRFSGFAWKDAVKKQTALLLNWLSDERIGIKGIPFLMQYNAPFVPGFLRRNEVGVEIDLNPIR